MSSKEKSTNIVLLAISFFIINSCSTKKNIYNIPKEKLYRTEKKYVEQYGHYGIDTNCVVKRESLVLVYKKGNLVEVGKEKNNKRLGYWFVFDDTLNLKLLVIYNKDKADTLLHPYSAPGNQRW